MIRTPRPLHLTRRLWARIQSRTWWLTCQGALSQTSSRASLPAVWSRPQHQARYAGVTAPTGRPSTKRRQVSPPHPPVSVAPRGARPPASVGRRAEQQAVAGQGLGVRIIRRDRLLDQPERLVRLGPTVQGRLRQAAPPDLVLEAQDPGRVARRQADQAVAATFFRACAGSGLVTQRFARFQPIPSRLRVSRIVSSLTRSAVKPCSKLTSAARSSVHRLVGLPKVRGLWCSSARRRSAPAASKAAR